MIGKIKCLKKNRVKEGDKAQPITPNINRLLKVYNVIWKHIYYKRKLYNILSPQAIYG